MHTVRPCVLPDLSLPPLPSCAYAPGEQRATCPARECRGRTTCLGPPIRMEDGGTGGTACIRRRLYRAPLFKAGASAYFVSMVMARKLKPWARGWPVPPLARPAPRRHCSIDGRHAASTTCSFIAVRSYAVGCGRATRPGAVLPRPFTIIVAAGARASSARRAQEGQMLDFWRDIGETWHPNTEAPRAPTLPLRARVRWHDACMRRRWSRVCTRSRLRPCRRPPGRAGVHPLVEGGERTHGPERARPSAYAPEYARVCAGVARVATTVPYRPGTALASLSPLCRARMRGLARPLPW